MEAFVSKLEGIYPDYFTAMKSRKIFTESLTDPVKKVRMYRTYINRLVSETPSPTAVNAWKLSLPDNIRFQLHTEEARAVHALGLHESVINSAAPQRSVL